ncbi:FAD-dependent thymidylate synthase [Candidatus Dependentiae bacterium]|nr:FAD-dependent thymidylate synthase [Candidatus Dependentiae bacterium]
MKTTNLEKSIEPLKDGIGSVELVRVSGSDVDVVNAARVSYGKFVTEVSERDGKLIRYLIKHKHTSPFEHNQFSFRIKCPMFVARQWMRHRMNSYNEISYRYVKAPLEFYVPPQWRGQDPKNRQASLGSFEDTQLIETYKKSIEVCVQTYEELLASGVCRELVRGVLPLCTYTQFIFTCNLQSLMHFMRLRLHEGAQYEIQMYARALLKLALPHFPVSLGEWKKIHMPELEFELIPEAGGIPTLEQTLNL